MSGETERCGRRVTARAKARGSGGVGRHVVSVIGPHSGCGKTTFVTQVVRHATGMGCLKISPAYDRPGPFPRDTEGIEQDFFLEDPTCHAQPGKDSTLYLQAGAARVERLRHRGDGLAAGLEVALACFPPEMPIIVESSSAASLLNPAAVVMVVRPPIREVKPATRAVLSLVTDLVANASEGDESAGAEIDRFRREFPLLNPRFTWWIDLIREPPPGELLARMRGGTASGRPA